VSAVTLDGSWILSSPCCRVVIQGMTKPRPFSTPTSIVKSELMNPEMEPHKTLWRCPSRSRVTSSAYPHTHTHLTPTPTHDCSPVSVVLQAPFLCALHCRFVRKKVSLGELLFVGHWRLQRLYGRLRKCWTKIRVLEVRSLLHNGG
jgi:hypothetical protein